MRAGELYETDTSIFENGPPYYWAVDFADGPHEYLTLNEWSRGNLVDLFYIGDSGALFVTSDDAVAFKLKFA